MSFWKHYREKVYELYFGWQRRLVPDLRDSQYWYADTLLAGLSGNTRWLDLGCGHRIVPAWTKIDEERFVRKSGFLFGIDRDAESLRRNRSIRGGIIADIGKLPFADASFDLISANMVVEHLSDPAENLSEIARALAPGGLLIFHTVNALHYHARIASWLPQGLKVRLVQLLEGRAPEDVYPTHYRLNSRDAVVRAADAAGFDVDDILMVNSSPETIVLGPVVLAELLFIRLLNRPRFANRRSNIVATLRRRPVPEHHPRQPAAELFELSRCT